MAIAKTRGRGFLARLASPFTKGWRFLKDVYSELQRVVWPSHEDTYAFTVVVILAVAIVAVWVGVLDFILASIMQLLGLGSG
jgi:preprotein translocase subunit SecE